MGGFSDSRPVLTAESGALSPAVLRDGGARFSSAFGHRSHALENPGDRGRAPETTHKFCGRALFKKLHQGPQEEVFVRDVQLGNSMLGAQVAMAQALTTRFSAKNEGYN